MHDYFTYNDGKELTKDNFKISASQFSNFFDHTSAWYHEQLLGESGFQGNTSSELGTVVHAGIEMFVREEAVDPAQITKYVNSIDNPDVDKGHILSQYEPMLDAVLPYVEEHKPDEVEKFVFQEVIPGVVAGGSIDALYTKGVTTIVDWKTTSLMTPPTKFSRKYWFQQMVYAWILKQQGYDIQYIKLVYITQSNVGRISEKTGKPLKDYPSQVAEVVEEVTQANLDLIDSCLKVAAESVVTFKEKPELRHLLAQDWRLREVKPRLFKNN